jgi:hypothetical protein
VPESFHRQRAPARGDGVDVVEEHPIRRRLAVQFWSCTPPPPVRRRARHVPDDVDDVVVVGPTATGASSVVTMNACGIRAIRRGSCTDTPDVVMPLPPGLSQPLSDPPGRRRTGRCPGSGLPEGPRVPESEGVGAGVEADVSSALDRRIQREVVGLAMRRARSGRQRCPRRTSR